MTCRQGWRCRLKPLCQSNTPPTPCHSSPLHPPFLLSLASSYLSTFLFAIYLLVLTLCPPAFISPPLSVSNFTKPLSFFNLLLIFSSFPSFICIHFTPTPSSSSYSLPPLAAPSPFIPHPLSPVTTALLYLLLLFFFLLLFLLLN